MNEATLERLAAKVSAQYSILRCLHRGQSSGDEASLIRRFVELQHATLRQVAGAISGGSSADEEDAAAEGCDSGHPLTATMSYSSELELNANLAAELQAARERESAALALAASTEARWQNRERERDDQDRVLRAEVERDEAELRQLRASAAWAPASALAPGGTGGALASASAQEHVLAGAEERRLQAIRSLQGLRREMDGMLRGPAAGSDQVGVAGTAVAAGRHEWSAAWASAIALLEQEKDVEREAALVAQEARFKLEFGDAVAAAVDAHVARERERSSHALDASALREAEAAHARARERAAAVLQRQARERTARESSRRHARACATAVRKAREELAREQVVCGSAVAELERCAQALESSEAKVPALPPWHASMASDGRGMHIHAMHTRHRSRVVRTRRRRWPLSTRSRTLIPAQWHSGRVNAA